MAKAQDLLREVRLQSTLWKAWRHVRESGLSSDSLETRETIKAFDREAHRSIGRIYRELLYSKYQFSPSKGHLKPRPGKPPRPIVVSQVRDRIVQRALLVVLQAQSGIKEFVRIDTSFGGLEERGVRSGIQAALAAMRGGAKYYARSDIKDFFGAIPKELVLEVVQDRVRDEGFVSLLRRAIAVELENLGRFGRNASLFPLYEVGVAQGCCLSPLLGNLLLHDFDLKLNGRGLHCLRYIDDFLILGPTERHVKAGMRKALALLGELGLTAYDPWQGTKKARMGFIGEGFTFLGCEVRRGLVHPDRNSRRRLISKVDASMRDSIAAFRARDKNLLASHNLVRTLTKLNGIVRGWGNQYSFCYDARLWRKMDRDIDEKLAIYLSQYRSARAGILEAEDGALEARRLLGVHLLEDSHDRPIAVDLENKRKTNGSKGISRRTWTVKKQP